MSMFLALLAAAAPAVAAAPAPPVAPVTAPAAVQVPAPPAAPALAVAEPSPDRLICKRAARTGTRFKTSVCRTKAEWSTIREQNLRDAADMINRPVIETRRGG